MLEFERKQKRFCKVLTWIEAHLCKLNCPQNLILVLLLTDSKYIYQKVKVRKLKQTLAKSLANEQAAQEVAFLLILRLKPRVLHGHTLHQVMSQPSIFCKRVLWYQSTWMLTGWVIDDSGGPFLLQSFRLILMSYYHWDSLYLFPYTHSKMHRKLILWKCCGLLVR